MATSATTNYITFSIEKISSKDSKKYKEQKKNEIANAICALLNSKGGKVEIRGEETKGNLVSTTTLHNLTRSLEQISESRFEAEITKLIVILQDKKEKMIKISVSKAPFLVTIKSNLCMPTQKQVTFICDFQHASQLMGTRMVDDPVELGSHYKTFLKHQVCELGEDDVIQFKQLKSASSKCFTLADRMIGRSNKFSCYVSAFANHRGGHIYYGIDDDGIVQGEEIVEIVEISEIEKKVEKAILKMIWPDTIGQPKRGEHWEIFFEQVLDAKSNPIPSTFVIVIFIAPCSGGVFTEEPESYEMVEGKVERMSFTTWKEKIQPVGLNKREQEVPSTIKRISLSPAARKRCLFVHEVLTEAINNNGGLKFFARLARQLERKYANNPEVKLVILARRVMANYRQGNIHEASTLLTINQELFIRAEEPVQLVFIFLKAVLEYLSDESGAFGDILTHALTIEDRIEPGLFTACVMLVAASNYNSHTNDERLSPDILAVKALEHLEHLEDAPISQADMYHTAHITSATYHLGYNLSGNVIKQDIDKESLQNAQDNIMAVNRSVCIGNPLTEYREIWFTLAQSVLYSRHSQFEPKKKDMHNKEAFKYAKKAENLAKGSGLREMVCWAQTTVASCVEALLLANLMRIKNIKVYKVR